MAQSGLSKMIDHTDGNNRLGRIAKILARAEQSAAELALLVLSDGAPPTAPIVVNYPSDFDLFTAGDVAEATVDFQAIVARAGALPRTEAMLIGRLMRLCLPGLGDAQYAACDAEIEAYLAARARNPEAPASTALTFADTHHW